MPRNKDIKKVLVIGSGPIVIGQAAEFDYAGTQACRSLKEEGVEVCLVNSNPTVSVFHLVCIRSVGQCHELMTETDGKDRYVTCIQFL